MALKLYVLIRDDISTAQQAVQAGHAVAQFAADYPREFKDWQEDNNTLIYLSIENIDKWKQILADGDFAHSVFSEPDLYSRYSNFWRSGTNHDDETLDTAIAVAPNWACQYLLFKDLPLAFQPKPVEKADPVILNQTNISQHFTTDAPKKKRWWSK